LIQLSLTDWKISSMYNIN